MTAHSASRQNHRRPFPRHPVGRRRSVRTAAVVAALAVGVATVGHAPAGAAQPDQALTYPLTGIAVGDPASYQARPALVVKIDNHPRAHPQAGLNEADIVFEEIVESGITRFAAVYNSTDSDPVGPIRSGRTQDVDLLGSFANPIFAYSGANAVVQGALAATGWPLLTEGDGMFRMSGRGGAPHNLFANTSDLFARGGAGAAAVEPQFVYGEPSGIPVSGVDLRVGAVRVGWQWDAEAGVYLRTQSGGEHATTTGQANTNNVVVLLVPYGFTAGVSGSPEAQTIGAGQAIVYSGGLKQEVEWTREGPNDRFQLHVDGEDVELTPGRTWVELANAGDYALDDR